MPSTTMLQAFAFLSFALFHPASAAPATKHPKTNTTSSPFQLRLHTQTPGGPYDGNLLVPKFLNENDYYDFAVYNFTPVASSSETLNLVNGLFQFGNGTETLLGGQGVASASAVYLEVPTITYTSGDYYIDQSDKRLGVTTSADYIYTTPSGKQITLTPKGTDHWAICNVYENGEPLLGLYFAMYVPHSDSLHRNCTRVFIEAEGASY